MKLCPFTKNECLKECALYFTDGCSLTYIAQASESIASELRKIAPKIWE